MDNENGVDVWDLQALEQHAEHAHGPQGACAQLGQDRLALAIRGAFVDGGGANTLRLQHLGQIAAVLTGGGEQ